MLLTLRAKIGLNTCCQALERYSSSTGKAQAFATLCKTLSLDIDVLQGILFHVDVDRLVAPIQHFIDEFKADEEFAAGQ